MHSERNFKMKKIILFLLYCVFCTFTLTSCRLCTYETIDVETEPLVDIDASGVKNIDFTDCTAEYVEFDGMPVYVNVFESMSSRNTDYLVKCLKEADLELTDDYDNLGAGSERFRIKLKSGDVIYIGYEDCFNPDIITINNANFKCDEDTIKKIKGKIRNYRIQTNGLWYYE